MTHTRQLTMSAVCMVAALAAAPAFAAPAGKADERARSGTECTGAAAHAARKHARTGARKERMDCIVVKGYPNQDGRAALRRSLEKEAKKGLSKVPLPSLKDLIGKKPTS